MKKAISIGGLLFCLAAYLSTTGCHISNHTAGRPDSEQGDGLDGSVTATKEGTGDPKVGSGRGQVGTDAPPLSESTSAPTSTGEHSDATQGKTPGK